MAEPGVGYLFKVEVDGLELGVFTKIDGLGAKYETQTVKEGGENTHVHLLPGRLTYENVKLTRPVDETSHRLVAWFTTLQQNTARGEATARRTANITAYGADHKPIAEWNLLGVYPVSYNGPSLQAGQSQVLSESVELAHAGFWSLEGSPAPLGGGGGARGGAGGGTLDTVRSGVSAVRTAVGQARGQVNRAGAAESRAGRAVGGLP